MKKLKIIQRNCVRSQNLDRRSELSNYMQEQTRVKKRRNKFDYIKIKRKYKKYSDWLIRCPDSENPDFFKDYEIKRTNVLLEVYSNLTPIEREYFKSVLEDEVEKVKIDREGSNLYSTHKSIIGKFTRIASESKIRQKSLFSGKS